MVTLFTICKHSAAKITNKTKHRINKNKTGSLNTRKSKTNIKINYFHGQEQPKKTRSKEKIMGVGDKQKYLHRPSGVRKACSCMVSGKCMCICMRRIRESKKMHKK